MGIYFAPLCVVLCLYLCHALCFFLSEKTQFGDDIDIDRFDAISIPCGGLFHLCYNVLANNLCYGGDNDD